MNHPLARTKFWSAYSELGDQRALAITGDPEGIWVGGMAGGMDSVDEASSAALGSCEEQRKRRRKPGPCFLYAVGSEIVQENVKERRVWYSD